MYYKYLEHFYRESEGKIKSFQDHFEKGWWDSTVAKLQFLSGKDVARRDGLNVDFE